MFANDVQKLVSERNLHMSDVDKLRDVAVELMNTSSRHEETVELQLTAFNHRWQDIDTRVKVFSLQLTLCWHSAVSRETQLQ